MIICIFMKAIQMTTPNSLGNSANINNRLVYLPTWLKKVVSKEQVVHERLSEEDYRFGSLVTGLLLIALSLVIQFKDWV